MRLVLTTAFLLPVCLWSQSNATDAAMGGYVRDESEAVVPGAKVTARNLQTNVETSVVTSQDGYYRFPLLRIGEYELKAEAAGFGEYLQTGIRLAVAPALTAHW